MTWQSHVLQAETVITGFLHLLSVCVACELPLLAVTIILFSIGTQFSCSDIFPDSLPAHNLPCGVGAGIGHVDFLEYNITESMFTHHLKGHTCYSFCLKHSSALLIFEQQKWFV